MISCDNVVEGKTTWEYDSQQRIKHQGLEKCLEVVRGKREIALETCGDGQEQKWIFNTFN